MNEEMFVNGKPVGDPKPDDAKEENNNPILYEISCTNTRKEYRLTVYANQHQNSGNKV